jgi:hypothetical protein
MRGLDPRIHRLREKLLRSGMDCRVKPGNDGVIDRSTIHPSCPALCRASTSYFPQARKTWMAGTSPAMTEGGRTRCQSPCIVRLRAVWKCNQQLHEIPSIVSHCFYQWILQPQRVSAFERENSHHGDVVEWHHAARCALV